MKAWFDHIQFHTKAQPQRPAIVLIDRTITYGMLAGGIESCAQRLAPMNFGGNVPVAITVKSPLRQMVLSLALMRIGVPSLSIEKISALAGLSVVAVLGDGNTAPGAGHRPGMIAVTDDWFAPAVAGGAPLPPGFANSRQVCRHSLTSGSTGESKLHADSIATIGGRVFNNFFGGIDLSRNGVLCMLGLSTTFGFANACATLAAGRTLYLADSSAQAIAMIELFSIDFLLASTEQVLSLAATARRTGAQVRSLRMIVMGGSVPTKTLLSAAMAYLSKDILCQYGATEIGLITRAMARDVLASPGLVGFVVPGVAVAVFDSNGDRCAAGQTGLIKVRHTADDEAGAPEGRNDPAWIALGDYGWFAPDGRLYVIGRTAAKTASDARIPTVLEAEDLMRMAFDYADAAALMRDTAGAKPLIQIGVVKNVDASADKIAAVLLEHGIDATVELVELPSIPRGVGGKVNRDLLKSALEAARHAQTK